jgi:P protein
LVDLQNKIIRKAQKSLKIDFVCFQGIDFTKYMLHMSTGVAFIMVAINLQLRFIYRDINDLRIQEPHDVTGIRLMNFKHNLYQCSFSLIPELKHELAVWQRAAASVSSYSKDEDAVRDTLLKKVRRLAGELKIKMKSVGVGEEVYKSNLEELQKKVKSQLVKFSLRFLTV